MSDPVAKNWQRYLYLGSIVILVLGLLAAALVFLTATRDVGRNVVGYRIEDGRSFPITLSQSRPDVRVLELQGGRANLAAAELDEWIASLWHGRRLAYVLVSVSLALAGLCALAGRLIAEP
jgi:hypothetical protein